MNNGTVLRMDEHRVSLAEARQQLGELLTRVNYLDERLVVTKHGKPLAAVVSMDDLVRLRDEAPSRSAPASTPTEPWMETMTIPGTRARVWWALSDARQRTEWWPSSDLDPEVGREFIQLWSDVDDVPQRLAGRIAEYEDGQRVRVQWDDGTYTTVELSDDDGATKASVTHTAGQPPPGWLLDLDELRAYLAARDPLLPTAAATPR